MIGETRTGNPKAEDFTGAWPKSFEAVAEKGLYDPDGRELWGKRYDIVVCRHVGEDMRPYIEAGCNKHGVKYSVGRWAKLERLAE